MDQKNTRTGPRKNNTYKLNQLLLWLILLIMEYNKLLNIRTYIFFSKYEHNILQPKMVISDLQTIGEHRGRELPPVGESSRERRKYRIT